MCLEMYEPDFLSAPGLAWEAALKSRSKLDLSYDIDMLPTVEEGITNGICHTSYQYGEADNKYMKIIKL